MVSVSYTDLHTPMNLETAAFTAVETEAIIDLAIDLLNLFSDANMSNLSGVAGAKTVTLTAVQRGAVLLVGRALYYSFFRDIESSVAGGESVSPTDVLANPAAVSLIKLAAKKLTTKYFERA